MFNAGEYVAVQQEENGKIVWHRGVLFDGDEIGLALHRVDYVGPLGFPEQPGPVTIFFPWYNVKLVMKVEPFTREELEQGRLGLLRRSQGRL